MTNTLFGIFELIMGLIEMSYEQHVVLNKVSYDQHVVWNFELIMGLIEMSFEQHVVLNFELVLVLIKVYTASEFIL